LYVLMGYIGSAYVLCWLRSQIRLVSRRADWDG
jgi:hypothetical protein